MKEESQTAEDADDLHSDESWHKAVRDLSVEQATKRALDEYVHNRHSHGSAATLAYHILTQDEKNEEAIFIMMERIEKLADGPLSVALSEYIRTVEASEEKKRLFDQYRTRRLILFHILNDPKGDRDSDSGDETPLEEWILDEELLNDFVQEGLGPTKSLKSSFEAARNLLGLDCGLIKHKRLGFSVPLAELYDSDQFEKTDEYEKFLDSRGYENPRQTLGDLSNWRYAMLASSMEFRDSYQLDGAYQTLTFKLLYHLLKIDEDNARGLRDLNSISESLTDTGISLALTEYVLERLNVKWIRVRAGALYRMRLHELGLLKHISGSEAVPSGSWEDPAQFVIDEQGLADLKKEALGASRTLRSIFEAVRTSIGVRAGLIRHKTLAASIPFAELCQPENFQETEEYAKFLSSEKLEEEPERHPALECLTVKSGLTS